MFTQKSKIMALILTVAMIITMLTACSSAAPASTTAPATTAPAVSQTAATEATVAPTAKEDPVTITTETTLGTINWIDYPDNPIAKYLLDKLNLKIQVIDWSANKDAMLASGDLPDYFLIDIAQRQSLLDSNFILKMNDLLDQYGPDIKANIPLALEFSSQFWGDGTGAIYCLPGGCTYEPIGYSTSLTSTFGLTVDWDKYEQLGFPKVEANWDSVLDLLKKMVALQPKTADNLPVYGIPVYIGWNKDSQMWGYTLFSAVLQGCKGQSIYSVVYNLKTNQLVDNYTDTASPLWQYVEFLYKENQAGIFDKDSLICTGDDLNAKATKGQYVAAMNGGFFSAANTLLNSQGKGYTAIEVEGGGVWGGADWRYGQNNGRCISATAKRPDMVMKFVNFCYSLDGARILNSGLEGDQWSYVNGVPTVSKAALALYQENGVGWKQTGIGNFTYSLMASYKHTDGYPVNLFLSIDIAKLNMSEFDKRLATHYGADCQLTYFQNLIKAGTMIDQSAEDMRIANMMPAKSDDMSRISSEADSAMFTGIAKCILAANDAEFAADKAALIQQVKDLGVEKLTEWYRTNYEKLRAEMPAKK